MKKLFLIICFTILYFENVLAVKFLYECIDTEDKTFKRTFEFEVNEPKARYRDIKYQPPIWGNIIVTKEAFSNYDFNEASFGKLGVIKTYYAAVRVFDREQKNGKNLLTFYTTKINEKLFKEIVNQFLLIDPGSIPSDLTDGILYETDSITNNTQLNLEIKKFQAVFPYASGKKINNSKDFSKVVMECVEQNKLSNLSEKERREMFLKIRDEIIKKKSK